MGATQPLRLLHSKAVSGADDLGRYTGTSLGWGAGAAGTGGPAWTTTCKNYVADPSSRQAGVVVFESAFPAGGRNTTVPGASSSDGVLSNFPLATTTNATAFLSWEGEFVRPTDRVSRGLAGGPVVFFDPADPHGLSSTVLVGSPLDNFKATSIAAAAFDGTAATWVPGTGGMITSLDDGFVRRRRQIIFRHIACVTGFSARMPPHLTVCDVLYVVRVGDRLVVRWNDGTMSGTMSGTAGGWYGVRCGPTWCLCLLGAGWCLRSHAVAKSLAFLNPEFNHFGDTPPSFSFGSPHC